MPGPLEGYTVVDLSQVVSGPLATMLLADQGAEVIKIEPLTGTGDISRIPAFQKNGFNAFFLNNNRGKRSLSVDLTADAGRQIVLDLCRRADVVVQNFRPGAVERLGIGYQDVAAVNPQIVYVSISGYGPDGPHADRPVFDPVIQAACGIISRQVNPDVPFPDLVRNIIADKSTSLTVAQAITAALLARERGHGGQHVQVPMLDACLYFFWPDGMMDHTLIDPDVSGGNLLSEVYSLTETADRKIVYFAGTNQQRAGVFAAVGHPEWGEDPRFASTAALVSHPENFVLLGQMLADAFLEVDSATALARLMEHDVPCGPVLSAEEVLVDPQVIHNQTLVEWDHPKAGRVRQPRPAARFSSTPAAVAASCAAWGEHNDEILSGLGRNAEEIAALRKSGVIG
jgi:crotonobetainyl-CoA:carnitine CoA-transferase CaiB-like acyl-CoA transferase